MPNRLEVRKEATFVSHLECSLTGRRYPAEEPHGLSDAGSPLLVRYHLEALGKGLSRQALQKRPRGMWRYHELLPVAGVGEIVSLGEVETPLVPLPRIAHRLGARALLVKDEARLPTGSFKARGLAVALTMAKAFGKTRVAVPTAGNAGAAAAAYGSRAGIETYVFTPEDTPEVTVREIGFHGARVHRVNGIIHHCASIVREGTDAMGWHDLSTLAEPYRLEGKKTLGFELAEQLDWQLPDVIYYPCGGGTGFIGMWKAFEELEALGWIGSKRPRMVAVQSTGCGPIVSAFRDGCDHVAEPWAPVETEVHGVRVPKPLGDRLILRVIYQSQGSAIAVSDAEAREARARVAIEEGMHLCPEGAICFAAYRHHLASGGVGRDERVVLFNTASGLKSPMPPMDRRLDCRGPIDYSRL